MLDVLELEKKWSKYHFKKMLPIYISSVFIIAIAAASSYVYLIHPDMITALLQKEKAIEKKIPVVASVKTDLTVVQAVKPQRTVEQNVLVPSFNFIYNLEDQVINYNNIQTVALATASTTVVKKKVTKTVKPKVKKKKVVKPKKKVRPAPKPKKVVKKPKKAPKKVKSAKKAPAVKQAIVIGEKNKSSVGKVPQEDVLQVGHSTTSKDELRSVIKRFNKSKKPALSLFIAKKYYEQGNYKESYKYARQTYKLNPKIEDGLILYAQSLAKLGKKDKAIAKLKPYIKKTGSVKAKILLSDIKKGNI